jgi:hypothetical protein
MQGPRPRVLALAGALVAIGTLAFLPTELDASSSCLPGALKSRLTEIKRKFGPVQVLSTYRGGARMPNGRSSYHASCRAVDFKPPAGKYSQVANWLKSTHGGGVGTYSCGMNHIHIDSGPRVRFHHCQRASIDAEIDGEAIRAARAEWPAAPGKGNWPLVIPAGQVKDVSRL